MDHTEFSRKGGSSRSERKQAASRANAVKARLAKANRGNTLSSAKIVGSEQQGEATGLIDSAGTNASKSSK